LKTKELEKTNPHLPWTVTKTWYLSTSKCSAEAVSVTIWCQPQNQKPSSDSSGIQHKIVRGRGGRENQKGNVKAEHCQCPITDKKSQSKREKTHETVQPLVFVSLDCSFMLIECVTIFVVILFPK